MKLGEREDHVREVHRLARVVREAACRREAPMVARVLAQARSTGQRLLQSQRTLACLAIVYCVDILTA
jgi:hypothetical protein